jgi:uncharacterized protein YjbI with pentapeptide repeats
VVDWGDVNYGLTNIPPTASRVVSVAAGSFHTLALRSDGRVIAWGDNSLGQTNVPASATNIVAIATGFYDNAALRADGTILAWGGDCPSPSPISGFANVVDVACPFNGFPDIGFLALRRDGTLVVEEKVDSPPAYAVSNNAAIAAGSWDGLALVGSGPPIFPEIPVNRTVNSGSTAYLRMLAVGALPLFYQWSCNGTAIPGATNPVLVLTNVQSAQAGTQYWLTASNALGTATNGPITLNETPSELYIQASTLSAIVGGTVTFTADVIGQGPFSYQWQFNGTNLDGATSSQLVLTNVQLNQTGTYSLIVSNVFGVVTNNDAFLNVVQLIITVQPQSQLIPAGTNATFTATATGQGPFSYQWQFNGTNVYGATNNPLVLTNVQMNQAGVYSVVGSNALGTATSGNANLSVVPLLITGQPQSQLGFLGLSVEFSVEPVFQGPFSYQWQFNGTNIEGATNNPLVLTNVQFSQVGLYSAIVANEFGTTNSANAELSLSQVLAWGGNGYGETNIPPALINVTDVVAIAASGFNCLALRANGVVVAWGNNDWGQATVPSNLANPIAVAVGGYHSLALKSDGTVVGWGYNEFGQTSVPGSLTNAVAIAGGGYFSFALRNDGTLVGWGDNSFGQLTFPAGLSNVVAIAAGCWHGLALTSDGAVVAWGSNSSGQTNVPIGLSNVVAIAADNIQSYALTANGIVVGWGDNSSGQTNIPSGLGMVIAIAAGDYNGYALNADGTVVIWGANSCGQTSIPPGLTNVVAVKGGDQFSLVLIGNDPPVLTTPLTNLVGMTNSFSCSLATQSGRVYALEYKNSLSDSNWTALPLAAGNGGMLTLTDPTATGSQRFYRVQQW